MDHEGTVVAAAEVDLVAVFEVVVVDGCSTQMTVATIVEDMVIMLTIVETVAVAVVVVVADDLVVEIADLGKNYTGCSHFEYYILLCLT